MNCKSFLIRIFFFLLALLIITVIGTTLLSHTYTADAHANPTPTCEFTPPPTPEPRPCELCYTLWLPQILIDETGVIEWVIIP